MADRRWIEAHPKALDRLRSVVQSGTLGTDIRFLALRSAGGFSGTGVVEELGQGSLAALTGVFGQLAISDCAHDGHGGPAAEAWLSFVRAKLRGRLVLTRLRSLHDGIAISGESQAVFLDARTGRLTERSSVWPIDLGPGGAAIPDSAAISDNAISLGSTGWRDVVENARALRHPWEIEAGREFRDLAGKRVLVCGATGFIGARLVERLVENGVAVTAGLRSLRNAARIARLGIELAQMGSGTDLAALFRGHDAVVNLAHDFHAAPARNLALATRIAEAREAADVPLLVQASSIAVYDQWPGAALDETSAADGPGHSYKELKRAIERDLEARRTRDQARMVMVQPTIVYGAFSALWTDRFADRFRIGDVAVPDQGLCEGVHVDDLADALLAAIANPHAAGRYIVSGPEPFAWRALLGAHASACDGWGELRIEAASQSPPGSEGYAPFRKPGAIARLRSEAMALAMAAARRHLGDERLARLRDRLLEAAAGGRTPLFRPAMENPRLFANRQAVSTARMRADLVDPRIGADEGARLVRDYLRWRYCPFADCRRG